MVLVLSEYTLNQTKYNLPATDEIHSVTITLVEDLSVKGEFEITIIEIATQKVVKIVGTFDAIGKTETV